MIPFNLPPHTGNEEHYVLQAIKSPKLSGDGPFGKKVQAWFEEKFDCKKALLTPSCTHALEMASILIDIKPGDEIIMPSYTFVSTANAFVLRGAKIVFVDIRPDTMNIDETKIEQAITSKSKAIVPVHYAGVACDMDIIMEIANRHGLYVIEDAAQGMLSYFNGKPLGTIGQLGTFSFHETKNFTSGGEGGLLLINDERFIERAEIIREKGTNRSQFFRGAVGKYSWVDLGSSYLPSELQAAYLWGQLQCTNKILKNRQDSWRKYGIGLKNLKDAGMLELPIVPRECDHNAHMFYVKVNSLQERNIFIEYMNSQGVNAVFHYVPLHSSKAGIKFSRFIGTDRYTTTESERLIRLPLYYGLNSDDVEKVIRLIRGFYG